MENRPAVYNKLVRDQIPRIIAESGEVCTLRTLDAREYRQKLLEKLVEEAREFEHSDAPEELADLLEVVYALAELQGTSVSQLEQIRLVKRARRGGFGKQILLERVESL